MSDFFQLIMIVGIILGNVLSVVIPYFRKLAEGKISTFDIKYLYHAIVSVLWQTVISLPLWIGWESPEGISWLLTFILAVAFGFGGKDLQVQIMKYLNKKTIMTDLTQLSSQY